MKKGRFFVNLLFIVLGALYVFYPSRAFLGDDLFFAQALEEGNLQSDWMFRATHLLYVAVWVPLYTFIQHLGFHVRSIYFLTFVNSIVSVASLFLFHRFARSIIRDDVSTGLATLFRATTIIVWSHSIGGGAYGSEAVFLVISFFMMYRAVETGHRVSVIMAGVSAGLATLFFVVNVLLVPIFFITYCSMRDRLRSILPAFLLPYLLVTIVPYALVFRFVLHLNSITSVSNLFFPPEFMSWISTNVLSDLPYFFYGQIRAIVSIEPIKNIMLQWHLASAIVSLVFILAAIAMFGVLIFSVRHIFAKRVVSKYGSVIRLSLVWVAVYSLFFLAFLPGTAKYQARCVIPFALLLGLMASTSRRRKIILAFAVLFLCIGNFVGQIQPQADISYNDDLRFTSRACEIVSAKDFVLVEGACSSVFGLHLGYFGGIPYRGLSSGLRNRREELGALLLEAKKKGQSVYAISDERKVNSGNILKFIDDRKEEFSIEGDLVKSFFKEYGGYVPQAVYEYTETPILAGNKIYRLEPDAAIDRSAR